MENCDLGFVNFDNKKEQSREYEPEPENNQNEPEANLMYLHEHADLSKKPVASEREFGGEKEYSEEEEYTEAGDDDLEGTNHHNGMTQYQECIFIFFLYIF
jgi:hypothetical protein